MKNFKSIVYCILLIASIASTRDASAEIKYQPKEQVNAAFSSDNYKNFYDNMYKNRNQKINDYQQELTELAKQKDLGHIGNAEYEMRKSTIQSNIDSLKENIKDDSQLVNKVDDFILFWAKHEVEKQHEEESRKTQIATAAATQAIANEGKLEQTKLELAAAMDKLKFLSQPENLKMYALFAALATIGIAGGYYGTKLIYNYIELSMHKKPNLALETSYKSWTDELKDSFWGLLGYTQPEITLEDNVVFCPEIQEQLSVIAKTTSILQERGLPHQSVLLYGPPGTGKTWYATILARMSGMNFVITSAERFSQFAEGKDIEELHYLIDYSQSLPRGTILFIDEIDGLGGSRDKLSDRWIKLQNAFLARTGKSMKDIKFIGASNRIGALDEAFLSRFPEQIFIPLPGQAEREKLIDLYVKKYITEEKKMIKIDGVEQEITLACSPEITPEFKKSIAAQLAGFSGRDIEQIVDAMRTRVNLTADFVLTKNIFQACVDQKIAQRKKVLEQTHKKPIATPTA